MRSDFHRKFMHKYICQRSDPILDLQQIIISKVIFQSIEMVHFIEVVVKVAIIGAGISGIGSSVEFSKKDVEHIVIEARNRTGGRITSTVLDGVTIDIGAEGIHATKNENLLAQILNEEGWEYKEILLFQSSSFVQPGRGQLSQATINQAHEINEDLGQKIEKSSVNSPKERSIQHAFDHYFGKVKNHTAAVDVAMWSTYYVGLFHGADLKDLSSDMLYSQKVDQAGLYVKGGYSNFVQSVFSEATPKKVHLNQKVTKIDYSGERVKIYTENRVFLAEKVVLTLPLGVLKQNSVEFIPELSEERKEAIQAMGFGIFHKIFVSFESPFWDTAKLWIGFVKKDGKTRYPMARYLSDKGKFILVFYTYASEAVAINKMSDEEIKADISTFLLEFYPEAKIVAKDLFVTRWSEDPLALGSYSYQAVGTNPEELITTMCEPLDNKVWFAGEHCHPTNYAYSHEAFQTGVWAAGNITQLLSS